MILDTVLKECSVQTLRRERSRTINYGLASSSIPSPSEAPDPKRGLFACKSKSISNVASICRFVVCNGGVEWCRIRLGRSIDKLAYIVA